MEKKSKLNLPKLPKFMSVLETALFLDVSKAVVMKWVKLGKIKVYRYGLGEEQIRFRVADLQKATDDYRDFPGGLRRAVLIDTGEIPPDEYTDKYLLA